MLKQYIEGANVTILNSIYVKPSKISDKKWTKGTIYIIYRDLNTGEKKLEVIEDPDYTYYMSNEGILPAKNCLFERKENVTPITTKYRNIDRDIADRTGNMDFYKENIYNKNRRANAHLHSDCVNVFRSDCDIEDYYRFLFNQEYKNKQFNPTKAYFDIETDIIDIKGDFPEPGECPVNAITYIDDEHKTVFTLLLENYNNPLIGEFENYMEHGTGYNDLNEFVKSRVGEKGLDKYKIRDMKYKIIFYDEEIRLIADFFKIVNSSKPDFIMAWNMKFDLIFLETRIRVLGYDPMDIMIHPDFKEKYYYYNVDQNPQHDMTQKSDFCKMTSYTVWVDQMQQFATRRKAKKGAFKNWKLDYIGHVTTGIGKLDYSHITRKLAELPYKDYKTFVFYNIMDTIVQICVENKVNDIDYLFAMSLTNNTRYAKAHNQTIYLVNNAMKEFDEKGLIIGNNKNKFTPKPTEKYPGAHVASPKKIDAGPKIKLNGLPVMIFENLDDFDYKAMYPSIYNEFNSCPNAQIGRIQIPVQLQQEENPYDLEHFDRNIKFMEDLHSHNWIEFGMRWFNLPSYKELCKDILYYWTNIKMPTYQMFRYYNGKVKPIQHVLPNQKVSPLKYVRSNEQPIRRMYAVPQEAYDHCDNIDITKIVYRENY